ncbi:MAG: hypothetical protein AAGF31_00465 [Planctomycetota bacterium]
MSLSKSDILAAQDRTIVEVPVPEWATDSGDAKVCVQGLTGDQVARLAGMSNEEAFRYACATALCDEEGNSLSFTEAEIMLLGQKSAAALRRVYSTVESLSGLGGDVEEAIAKNSPTRATDGGGSPSASTTESPSENSSSD